MYLSETTPYNSYNGIYPQRLLTTIIQEIQFLTTYNYDFIINERYYDLQLETALCYQHYFCNTELRTAIITKIKGLSIQAQQNTFVLFTLFKLTLDERKTLTKISTHKPLTAVPQTSAHLGHEGTRKPANCNLRRKAFCICVQGRCIEDLQNKRILQSMTVPFCSQCSIFKNLYGLPFKEYSV